MRVQSPRPATRGGESVSSGGGQTINKDPPAPLARGDFLKNMGMRKMKNRGVFNLPFLFLRLDLSQKCALPA